MTNIGRHTFRLDREERRPVLHAWVDKMPVGAVLEFRDATRTEEQNDKMWPLLREIARQVPVHGKTMSEEWWKNAFLILLGKEVEWGPALNGQWFVPVVAGSSKLTVKEFSDLIALRSAYGAEHGVEFKE